MRVSSEATCEPLAQRPDRTLLAWLMQWLSRPPRGQTNSLADLTDEHLRDIGVDPGLLSASKVGQAERIGLLDLGWQEPRQPRRR